MTIEHKGPIPRELRPRMGNRIYGCDDCLAVCPWNKFAQIGREAKLAARAQLRALAQQQAQQRTPVARLQLWAQGACAALLVVALGMHWAEVGLIGLLIVPKPDPFTANGLESLVREVRQGKYRCAIYADFT